MNAAPDLSGVQPSKPSGGPRHFDPILRPDLAQTYEARGTRLRALAEGHELAEYLRLAAEITDAQAQCLSVAEGGDCGVDWQEDLERICATLAPRVPEPVRPHLAAVAAMEPAARAAAGTALLGGRFEAVEAGVAPFLWAALSVNTARSVRAHPLPPEASEESAHCPMCGTAPVASVIHTGTRAGLRYLHCARCECEWHVVRAKCSCCGDAGALDYLSFETAEAAIRAESCGACGSYLKVVSLERDPQAEVVADDLSTLALDEAAVAEGFARTGFNPFALPG